MAISIGIVQGKRYLATLKAIAGLISTLFPTSNFKGQHWGLEFGIEIGLAIGIRIQIVAPGQ